MEGCYGIFFQKLMILFLEGHLAGLITGVVLSFIYKRQSIKR
jgi:membrane associated rhomboid family serine protease